MVLLVAYQVLLVLGCCLSCLHWWVMLQLGAMLGLLRGRLAVISINVTTD